MYHESIRVVSDFVIMKRLLQISINTLEWTDGNHVWFDAMLKPDTSIEVHWGDGSHSTLCHHPGNSMSHVDHYYKSAEGKKIPYEIEFLSEDSDSLLVLIDGTWETEVNNVIFEDSPALTYLQYTQLSNVDYSGCSNLETLVVNEYYADKLELSVMPQLKKVICRSSQSLKSLDLTKNSNIEELDISHCNNLRRITLSNNSRLKILANDYTELDTHSLKWLQTTVERNVGKIQDENQDQKGGIHS